jgi:hypothetical protein
MLITVLLLTGACHRPTDTRAGSPPAATPLWTDLFAALQDRSLALPADIDATIDAPPLTRRGLC